MTPSSSSSSLLLLLLLLFSLLYRDDSDISSFQRYEDDPSAIISRTTASSTGNSSHRTLPLPGRKPKKPIHVTISASNISTNTEPSKTTTAPVKNSSLSEKLQTKEQSVEPLVDQLNYDRSSKDFDQLTWDVVMGDISNYCR